MCLYPRKYINKKYTPTEKNGGCVPEPPIIGYDQNGIAIYDNRVLNIEIPCGNCKECCEKKAREWQVRLAEEIKDWKYKYFVTLTFSPEAFRKLVFNKGIKEDNEVAAYALRHCIERYRKEHKKTLRHWFITELGHQGTERVHMHGILFCEHELEFKELERKKNGIMSEWNYWKYGIVFRGNYVNMQTVNYIVKYMNKLDTDHKGFKGRILASPGIGKRWIERPGTKELYKYRPKETIDFYRLNNGAKVALPKYYKNKTLKEDERELVWRETLDKEQSYIAGIEIDNLRTKGNTINNILEKAKEVNNKLEYGDDSIIWRKKEYYITKEQLRKQNRENNLKVMQAAIEKRKKLLKMTK